MLQSQEKTTDKIICSCGNDEFRVYISIIIDDARIYCTHCDEEY